MSLRKLWKITNNIIGKTIALDSIFDSGDNNVKVGTVVEAEHDYLGYGQFIALKGVASLAIGDAVVYNPFSGVTERAVTASHGVKGIPIAISLAANTSTSKLSWFQIVGNAIANAPNSALTTDTPIYLTSGAGVLDDAIVAGSQLINARSASASNVGSVGGIALASNQFVLALARAAVQSGAVS
jgi:hypothetical protein